VDRGIRLGSVFGIDVSLDYSWFLIFVLITAGLSFALFPQFIPGYDAISYLALGLVTSLLFFGSVFFHEMMHSLVAKSHGMNIEGIRLMLFGGVSQLTEEPRTPGVEFKMAIAGPLSSILLGGFFLGLSFAGAWLDLDRLVLVPMFWLGYINIVLGIFNLLPGYPLDGGRVLRSVIWHFTDNLRRATLIASGFGKGLAYLMILGGIIGPFIGNASLLWFILLGWYLLRSAETGYQQVVFGEAIEGMKVNKAMTENPETVNPDLSIEQVVKEHFMQHQWTAYPVVENDHVEGMITINNLEELPRKSWKRKRVRDVMKPLSTDFVTSPDEEVSSVIPKLVYKAEGRMLVMKGEHLEGILTENDINRAIYEKLNGERGQEKDKSERKNRSENDEQRPAA